MDEDKIRQFIEEIDPEGKLPPGRVEDFIQAVKEQEVNPIEPGTTIDGMTFDHLKQQLETETDWRKRAAIAAKMISLGLE